MNFHATLCVNEYHIPCPSELYSVLAMHWSAISACGLRSCKQLGLIIRHISAKQVRPVDVKPVQEVLNGVWDALWYVPLLVQLHHRHRHLRHCVQVASSGREEFLGLTFHTFSSLFSSQGATWLCWWPRRIVPGPAPSPACPHTSPSPWRAGADNWVVIWLFFTHLKLLM